MDTWRKEHHQASHLCYAYHLGFHKELYRANDDGEPSNSAGAPILGQLQSFDLTHVLVGVVRYYGGTKLGVGGLIHAYRAAAQEAIFAGEIVEKVITQRYILTFHYDEMPFIMNFIKSLHLEIIHQAFETTCFLEIEVPLPLEEQFAAGLTSYSTLTLEK